MDNLLFRSDAMLHSGSVDSPDRHGTVTRVEPETAGVGTFRRVELPRDRPVPA